MNKKKLLSGVSTLVLSMGMMVTATGHASASTGDGIAKQMKERSHGHFNINWNKDKTSPTFTRGNLSAQKAHTLADVKSFLKKNEGLYNVNPRKDLTLLSKKTDKLGMTHYEFAQTVKGVKVNDARFTVHVDKDGTITAVSGQVFPKAAKFEGSVKPDLNKKQAIDKAWNHIDLSKEATVQKVKNDGLKGFEQTKEKSDLVVYPHDGEVSLAYHVQLQFINPYGANWQIYVDAKDGHVISANNAVENATGSGYGVLGDYKTLHTYLSGGTYYLYDTTKPMSGVIETVTADYGTSLPGYWLTESDNTFYSNYDAPAVDAHVYAGDVYDFYYNKFGRNSFDGNGADIVSSVHYSTNYNNAFWNGNQMVYGDGDGSTFIPLSGAEDVVGHELTHAVTQYTANLNYSGQSGALNESMSDVFGTFIQNDGEYLIGEDVYTPGRSGDALRSMKDPTRYGQPDNMSGYVYTSSDNGGVHTNSGIPNKAAYLTMSSIGWSKAEKIYYRALTTYLAPTSTFSDARQALLQSAADLYGTGSEYNAVASAWNQVGVY